MMLIKDFAEAYRLNLSSITATIATNEGGRFNDAIYYEENSSLKHVNPKFFTRRKDFKKKVQIFNNDIYYLMSEYLTDTKMAKEIGVEVELLTRMFAIDDSSIIDYRISGGMWKIFRWGRMIVRDINHHYTQRIDNRMQRQHNLNFSITKILDRRTYED